MPVQAALRDQARGEQSHQQKSETQAQQFMLHDDGNCGNDRQNDEERNSAGEPPQFLPGGFAIEPAIERIDQPPDPARGMSNGAKQAFRITETEFDQHGDEGKRDRHDVH